MKEIVVMIRAAGAKKVYLASTSPPVRFPNLYGITTSFHRCSFAANGRTNEEVSPGLQEHMTLSRGRGRVRFFRGLPAATALVSSRLSPH